MYDEDRIPGKQEWPALTIEQLQMVKPALVNYYYAMRSCESETYKHYESLIRDLDEIISQKEANAWLEENQSQPTSVIYCG